MVTTAILDKQPIILSKYPQASRNTAHHPTRMAIRLPHRQETMTTSLCRGTTTKIFVVHTLHSRLVNNPSAVTLHLPHYWTTRIFVQARKLLS